MFEPPTAEENLNVVQIYLGQDGPIHNPHLAGDTFFWPGSEVGVLLLHGLTATTAEVRLLAEKLHAAGYTISAPLLPGHGTHPDELNETTWHDWAWTAEKAYQYLATVCDQVFVGGESTGGALALYLAAQHKEIAGVYCATLRPSSWPFPCTTWCGCTWPRRWSARCPRTTWAATSIGRGTGSIRCGR
jgi:alpha-beta hydrolase superfamily lysophospholipase